MYKSKKNCKLCFWTQRSESPVKHIYLFISPRFKYIIGATRPLNKLTHNSLTYRCIHIRRKVLDCSEFLKNQYVCRYLPFYIHLQSTGFILIYIMPCRYMNIHFKHQTQRTTTKLHRGNVHSYEYSKVNSVLAARYAKVR